MTTLKYFDVEATERGRLNLRCTRCHSLDRLESPALTLATLVARAERHARESHGGVESMNVKSTSYLIDGVAMMNQIEVGTDGVITVRLSADARSVDITPETAMEWSKALARAATLARQIESARGAQ